MDKIFKNNHHYTPNNRLINKKYNHEIEKLKDYIISYLNKFQ